MSRLVAFLTLAACLGACATQPPPPPPPPVARIPAAPIDGVSYVMVTVRPGETLYGIARENRVALETIIRANGLTPPYTIFVGQTLMLPFDTHVVQPGETVESIARRYGVSPRAIVRTEAGPLRANEVVTIDSFVGERAAGSLTPPQPRRPAPELAPAFAWPSSGAVIDGYGPKPGGRRNDGVNIAVAEDSPVCASFDGTVIVAESTSHYGELVVIEHEGGWRTLYAHNRRLRVREGQSVSRGQVIAYAGATGDVASPQLHFEVRYENSPVDPLRLLPQRSR